MAKTNTSDSNASIMPWRQPAGVQRQEAARRMLELLPHPDASRPVPAIFHALPWADDDDEAVQAIMERILMAESLEAAGERQEAGKINNYLGEWIKVHDIRVRPSELENGCGCYLVLDVTPTGSDEHQVVTTSAMGVMVLLARAYLEDRLPLMCMPVEIQTGKKGRNNPIYLQTESGEFE